MRKAILSVVAGAFLLTGSLAFAEEPMQNINPKWHPNLAAAQKLSRKAFDKIVEAQQANEFDMEGHAQKAKELLDQVNHELKLAAEAANKHRHKDKDREGER